MNRRICREKWTVSSELAAAKILQITFGLKSIRPPKSGHDFSGKGCRNKRNAASGLRLLRSVLVYQVCDSCNLGTVSDQWQVPSPPFALHFLQLPFNCFFCCLDFFVRTDLVNGHHWLPARCDSHSYCVTTAFQDERV